MPRRKNGIVEVNMNGITKTWNHFGHEGQAIIAPIIVPKRKVIIVYTTNNPIVQGKALSSCVATVSGKFTSDTPKLNVARSLR